LGTLSAPRADAFEDTTPCKVTPVDLCKVTPAEIPRKVTLTELPCKVTPAELAASFPTPLPAGIAAVSEGLGAISRRWTIFGL
jgi:hypothetical protein